MAAIGLSAKDASFEIDCFHEASSNPENATLVISCINSFSSVTVSGHENQLEPFIESLASRKIFARQLRVKLGYHSEQMKQVAGEYGKLIGRLEQGHARRSIMVSSVTGTPVDGPSLLGPQYWVQNMVQPVRFLDAMQHCSKRSDQDTVAKKLDQSHQGDIVVHGWLEIGPHSVLKGPIRQILETFRKPGEVAYTSALIRDQSGLESVLSAAGQLHCLNFHTDVKKAVCLAFHSPHRKVLTSVPSYPFDHSTLHWEEPKASQDYRFRPRGSLPFLGLRINSSGGNTNSLESEWKLLINNDTMPWVNDHKVNNSILYPAAGMLVMVIEAVKEISAQVPVGFELYNVEFPAPIVVGPNTEGTEVHLHLSQMTKERNSNQRFRILVHKGDGSIELVCQGTARAVMDSDTADLDEKDRKDQRLRERQERHIKASQQCFHEIDNVEMYKTLRNHLGLDYGPAFQVLTDIRSDQHNQAVAIVSNYHEDSESLPVVHPSRLDGVFQLAFAAISTTRDPRTMIPTRVGKLFVSSRGFGHGPEGRDKAFTKSRSLLPRCARFDITVVSEDYKYIKSSIEDLEVRAISSDPRAPATLDEAPYSCSKMVWEPALDMLNQEETLHYCEIRRPKYEEPDKFLNDVRAATTVFGIRALRNVAGGEKVAVEMEQYYTWLQTHLGSHVEDEVSGQELEEIMSRIQSTVRGQLHIDVGQNLTDILCGRRDPLQLLFHEEERVGHFYQEMVQDSSAFAVFGRYLHSLVHQTPNLRFLEIGGGTGSTTEEILKVVQSRFKEYIFTDISPFFFEKAETRFKKKKMSYSVLDIENDPCSQGFEQSNYDIIIADNVLHTTADLMKTLANVRKLLRPGGKLILKELVQPDDLLTGFVFGLLPGWWHGSEEFRILSPVVIETKWDELLRHAGFSGVDLVFRDHKGDSSHQWSIMIASHNQVQDQSSPGQTPVVIIADPSSLFQGAITAGLNRRLGTGQAVEEISLIKAAQASQERNLDFIALVETERPLVAEINEEAFLALQSITQNARSLVWVTKGGSHWTPGFSATNGLFRVLRNEKKSVPIISVALELAHDSSPERPPDHIKNVFHQLQQAIKNGTEYEPEYTELEGRLCVNRLIRATALDEHIFTESSRPVLPQEIGDRTLKLGIRVPGLLDTLEWSTDSLDDGPILPDEIQVEVRAIGVNFKDCLTLLGRVDTDRLGGECAGFVTGIGSNISEFNIGDRVVVGGIDSYKTVVRTYNENTMRIPETMSFPQAASIPVTFCTAYYSLVEMARLKKGETVLISAAAGGTGQAALQIAQHIGAEIFATVGSESKKKDLMEEYGISEDHILFSRNDRFIDTIWEKTNGRGVDVVLNSATGRLLTASWECIASFGRFVDIGLRDAISHGSLPMGPFSRSATFSAVDLSMIMRAQHGLGKSVLGKVMDLFRDGKLRTASPLHIFGVEDGEDAMRFLQGGKSSGKIALEVNRSAVVPVCCTSSQEMTHVRLLTKRIDCDQRKSIFNIEG
jgi:NADPH:quinone reductase-like Zn-dependent oxidoreductase/SAM-dependent methyltransferase